MHSLSKKSVFTWEILGKGEQGDMGSPSLPSTLSVSGAHRADRGWIVLLNGIYYIQLKYTSYIFHNSFSVFTKSSVNDNAATENVLVKALN